jgi:quercetin dioxygenase-like cupin family protein
MVVYGRLKLEVDGEILLLDSGTAVRIPPNVPHTAWPAERDEVLNIDVFAPIRADYLFLAGHQHDKFDTDLEIREGADPPSYGPK